MTWWTPHQKKILRSIRFENNLLRHKTILSISIIYFIYSVYLKVPTFCTNKAPRDIDTVLALLLGIGREVIAAEDIQAANVETASRHAEVSDVVRLGTSDAFQKSTWTKIGTIIIKF